MPRELDQQALGRRAGRWNTRREVANRDPLADHIFLTDGRGAEGIVSWRRTLLLASFMVVGLLHVALEWCQPSGLRQQPIALYCHTPCLQAATRLSAECPARKIIEVLSDGDRCIL